MDNDDRVLTSFHHLIEITDGAVTYRRSQWTVVPDCLFTFQQKTTNQVCGGKVFVTGQCDQRSFQAPGHVLDKTRLPTAGGSFKDNWQVGRVCSLKQFDLAADREIVRFCSNA